MTKYYEVLNGFIAEFCKEFGERSFNNINEKIGSSNKISNLIRAAKDKRLSPLSGDIVPNIMSIPSFMFSNNMKVALASYLAFERWNQECNQNEEYLSDFELCSVLRGILKSCGQML